MPDEEVIELEKGSEAEEVKEQIEGETQEEPVTETEPESEEVEITIEGEEPVPEVKEAEWVKNVRKESREKEKRIRELEEKLKAVEAPKVETELGPKPTLESVEFDTDVFEQKLDEWKERKRTLEAKAEAQKAEVGKAQAEYVKRLEVYQERKKASPWKDIDDAEDAVKLTLNPIQQSILVKHAIAPENVVYYLGKNPEKAKEIGSIQDPIAFALSMRDLESKLKVTKKTAQPKPQPETIVSGSSKASGANQTLEQLEAEADRTGDRSKVLAFKRKLRSSN